MAKYIPSWKLWDWQSILRAIALFTFLIGVFIVLMNGADFFRHKREKRFNSEATATIVNVHRNTEISQTDMGTHQSVNSIFVRYRFDIDGKIYLGEDVISNSGMRGIPFVDSLLNGSIKTVSVKYMHYDPNQSQIVLK